MYYPVQISARSLTILRITELPLPPILWSKYWDYNLNIHYWFLLHTFLLYSPISIRNISAVDTVSLNNVYICRDQCAHTYIKYTLAFKYSNPSPTMVLPITDFFKYPQLYLFIQFGQPQYLVSCICNIVFIQKSWWLPHKEIQISWEHSCNGIQRMDCMAKDCYISMDKSVCIQNMLAFKYFHGIKSYIYLNISGDKSLG
jgi:hypothetical protein